MISRCNRFVIGLFLISAGSTLLKSWVDLSSFPWLMLVGLSLLSVAVGNNWPGKNRQQGLIVLLGLLIFLVVVPQVSTETTRLFADPVEQMSRQQR